MNLRTLVTSAIAVILVGYQYVASTKTTCDSPKCVQEASKIIDYIDTTVNPCEDFYQFACGNFLKSALGNEKLELTNRLKAQDAQEILAVYQEDIHENDHKMVKVAKNLYRGCMNKWELQRDFIKTLGEVFKKIGGWPVVEGSNWKETNFDWLNATYELRKLGFDSTAFLSLEVLQDWTNPGKRIFVVNGGVKGYVDPKVQKDIAHMAVLFGAENEETAFKDLTEANRFIDELHELRRIYPELTKQTVEEIQKNEGVIDWLKFINNLIGPKFKITDKDSIFFPTKHYLKKVIELITKTSKRTQANYLMWKVIQPLLPFLPDCPAIPEICGPKEERSEFCVRELHMRLITTVPDPVDVVRLRRYLSEEKKAKVQDLVTNIVSKFEEYVGKVESIPEKIKNKVVVKIKEMRVVVGMPENYFDEKVFDDADFDLGNVEEYPSFFTLLAQVFRNLLTATFSRANQPAYEHLYGYYFLNNILPTYYSHNLLYIPLSASKSFLYDENRPEYLNYGTLGRIVGSELGKMLATVLQEENQNEDPFRKSKECLGQGNDTSDMDFKLSTAIETIIGEEISYGAYEEWVKKNGEEFKLVASNYTGKELFWISAVGVMCQPIGVSRSSDDDYERSKINANLYSASESIRHNNNFSKDFNCPLNSKSNPENKCKIIL